MFQYFLKKTGLQHLLFQYLFKKTRKNIYCFNTFLRKHRKNILCASKKRKNELCCTCFRVLEAPFSIVYRYLNVQPKIIIYWTKTSFIACLYLLPIASFLIRKVSFSFKPLEILGKASFNIFLVQMVYYVYAVNFMSKLFPSHIAHLFANIAICVIFGLVFYFLEQPITKFVLSLWKKRISR